MGRDRGLPQPWLFIDGTKFEREAYPLYQIMLRSIGPYFHRMTFAELLFCAYLAGFEHALKATESEELK